MMKIIPISFKNAATFVAVYHRHNKPPVGHKFSIAVADDDGMIHGVAMVGRPIARHMDDGRTLEVNRCCTDGTKNACSMLYGAAWRAAQALGYTRIITYTLASEPGTSLHAAGWKFDGECDGKPWTGKRYIDAPSGDGKPKRRWKKEAGT